MKAMVPATVGVGSGVPVALGVTEGDAAAWRGAADGEVDAAVPEPPQAARASAARTGSANVATEDALT
jgi:hypothetical protein